MDLTPPLDDLTPEEWREVAASAAPYVATRVGPVSTAVARIFLSMEDPPPVIRYGNGDWALVKEEGRDAYFLAALLPEPDGPAKWRVDAHRDVMATAEDLRSLATLILDVIDGGIGGVRYPALSGS